jgi:hypothetical protein
MTTYAYRITLNDSELIAVKEALEFCLKFSGTSLNEIQYRPNISAISAVLSRLFDDTAMTSTSSSCWPKEPGSGDSV